MRDEKILEGIIGRNIGHFFATRTNTRLLQCPLLANIERVVLLNARPTYEEP